MNKFDIILWDLDNTLLDFTESERYSITECFSRAGLSIDDSIIETYSAINLDYWKQDPLAVAKTGLEKMKKVVALAS